jgi:hypothetical protein
MALSLTERRFADQHRQLQNRLAALTTVQLRSVWRLLNPDDLTGTTSDWLAAALRIVAEQNTVSAGIARAYIRQVRTATVGAPQGTLPAPGFSVEAARTSLLVTGPVRIERARRRGLDVGGAALQAFTESSRAGSRHAINGGRDTITQYASTDRRAGWSRVTSGNACDFCSLLAGRGAVYSAGSVSFEAHDGCGCSGALEFR